MVDQLFPTYALRSIQKALVDAAVVTAVAVQMPGQRQPAAVPEWLRFTPLAMPRDASRSGEWHGRILFQVTCFSLFAELRPDNLTDAPQVLASKVMTALDNQDIQVMTYGSQPLALLCSVKLGAGSAVYLNERALAFPGAQGADSLPNDVHAVALTFPGYAFIT